MRKKLLVVLPLMLLGSVFAQKSSSLIVSEEDRKAADALVFYSEDLREAILEVSLIPQVIMKIAELQRGSNSAFRKIVSRLSRKDQSELWELIRYPDLIFEITTGMKKKEDQLRNIAKPFSPEIQDIAAKFGRKHYKLLKKINKKTEKTEKSMDKLLESYPLKTQVSLRKLIRKPEILSLLQENIALTRRVGNAYRSDPEGLKKRISTFADEVDQKTEEVINGWKKTLEENPEAATELQAAAESFAKEKSLESLQTLSSDTKEIQVNIRYDPYPYWYGYPYWHSSSYWYPYPSYYHSGFYYGTGGAMVVIGMPSYSFAYWSYGSHYHHAHYSNFHSSYYRHVETHVNVPGGGGDAVKDWVDKNQDKLPPGFENLKGLENGKIDAAKSRYGGSI
ncbi:hypothetical protein BVX98_01770, partial [bacterium F11]